MTPLRHARLAALALAALLCGSALHAGEITVAVAANFTAAAEKIGTAFEQTTGNHVTYSFGASGQLYTQISQGAPFDVFLSADQARPEKAEAEGLGVAGTRFTYAWGKLVLWSADPAAIDGSPAVLSDPALAHVAIATPAAAPYGAAAVEVMKALGLYEGLQPKLVEGKSISQTLQFVETGNAPVGFVALSQVTDAARGSRWLVPADLYTPIRQDAVLLARAEGNATAKAYLDFLRGAEGKAIIESFGYETAE